MPLLCQLTLTLVVLVNICRILTELWAVLVTSCCLASCKVVPSSYLIQCIVSSLGTASNCAYSYLTLLLSLVTNLHEQT